MPLGSLFLGEGVLNRYSGKGTRGSGVTERNAGGSRIGNTGFARPGGLETKQGRRPVITIVYVEMVVAHANARISRGMFSVVEN